MLPGEDPLASPFARMLRDRPPDLGDRPATPHRTGADARPRLLGAIAEVGASQGFAATTVADVVAMGRTSLRTFYQHYDNKEACFEACCDAASRLHMQLVAGAANRGGDIADADRLPATIYAYLETLAAEPAMTRFFLVDSHALGGAALRVRARARARFVDLLRDVTSEDVDIGAFGHRGLDAFAGGLNELALLALEQRRPEATIRAHAEAAAELFDLLMRPVDQDGRARPASARPATCAGTATPGSTDRGPCG